MKKYELKDIVWLAFLAAIMIISESFPGITLPFFPSFLTLRVSALPAIIAALALGPVQASLVVVIGITGGLLFNPTATQYVGELANLILWISAVWAIAITYKKINVISEEKKALLSLVAGGIAWTVMAILANIFILVPFFITMFFNGDASGFVGAISMVPGVTENNFMLNYILFVTIPFTLLQALIVGVVSFLVHNRIKELYTSSKFD